MPSFNDVAAGSSADSSCVQQIIDALKGTAGKGVPLSITAVSDGSNWAVDVQNDEAVNSRAFRASRANGTVLIQADVNGVQVSSTGGAPATVVNISDAQTLTNKTLSAPTFTGGVFSGWSTWTPALTQGGDTPTLTVSNAGYAQFGKDVSVEFYISATSTGAAANDIIITTLPVVPKFTGQFANIGTVVVSANAAVYVCAAVATSSAQIKMLTSTGGGYLGNTNGPSFAIAAGNVFSGQLHYQST